MYSREQQCLIWLSQANMPALKMQLILKIYHNGESLWDSFSGELKKPLGDWAYGVLARLRREGEMERVLEALHKNQIKALFYDEIAYPPLLKQISDFPIVLYAKGDSAILHRKSIAIIGTRKPSRYGREAAHKIAKELGQNEVVVISGFAAGIDTAAHEGCLDGGGKTAAIMACGLDKIYPSSNRDLAQSVLNTGGVFLSEYALGTMPLPRNFPARNRLISGLCQGTVFVEGKIKSGGMLTVGHALNQGREVFAVPGPITQEGCAGPHTLIREGARLAASGQEIIEDMKWQLYEGNDTQRDAKSPKEPLLAGYSEDQQKIMALLLREELAFEDIATKTGLSPSELNSLLMMMELGGLIQKIPGNIYKIL